MKDPTPACVVDEGNVSSGGLHCQIVQCVGSMTKLAAAHAAPHATHATNFLAWLFG